MIHDYNDVPLWQQNKVCFIDPSQWEMIKKYTCHDRKVGLLNLQHNV